MSTDGADCAASDRLITSRSASGKNRLNVLFRTRFIDSNSASPQSFEPGIPMKRGVDTSCKFRRQSLGVNARPEFRIASVRQKTGPAYDRRHVKSPSRDAETPESPRAHKP